MAKFNVVDMNGQHVSEIELSDAVFGITPNEKAVHIAVVNFLANQRQGTQNTKIRMEVSGGGKKPWHRPRSSGFHPCTAVDSRRRRSVAWAPSPGQLQLPHQQQGQAPGSAERPVRQGCQWQHGRC